MLQNHVFLTLYARRSKAGFACAIIIGGCAVDHRINLIAFQYGFFKPFQDYDAYAAAKQRAL